MNRIKTLLMLCLTFLLVCCASPLPGENVSKTEEALGTCPRPTGTAGDSTYPFASYISGIHVHATNSWKLSITSKSVSTPYSITNTIDFGGTSTTHSQAKLSGPGWTANSGSRLKEMVLLTSSDPVAQGYGCINDSNLVCWVGWEDPGVGPIPMIYFNKGYSFPADAHIWSTNGLTAILGTGATTPQTMKLYWDTGSGSAASQTLNFSGPAFDTCFWP